MPARSVSGDGFNLSALVREVCDTSTITDPAMLAKEVNRRIKKTDRDAALEQALRSYVLQFVARSRSSSSDHNTTDAHERSAAGGTSSRKVRGIRETWRRHLRDRIAVGDDWKFLADCTFADLEFAATSREEHARKAWANAAHYRHLGELLTEHGVDTVGQLPESVLASELGRAA